MLHALAIGDMTTGQATGLLHALANQARLVETDELARRIAKLEEQQEDARA